MASSSGTATNLEDLFGKIITFLTTNAALVAASQQWQVLRQYRDNVASITTNLVESATYSNRRILHSFRWDPRSINTNDPSSATQGAVQCTSYVAGTSYISLTLRTAKEIKSVRLTTNGSGSAVNEMLQNFRLQ